ncbi:hypothetical protein RGQ29_023596 [Quercus rubra]|uniref:S-protein homolog n=1 Tax=Quercus rubra TaxID=3512 RepID=A0AAN7F6N2_QUERU|nr:hypothetical protein RGQ29_023596 [Quercus rubra]
MNRMIIAQLYCFVFILLLAFGQSTSSKSTNGIFTRYVRIVNHLNKKPLTYHCKSADDDLGLRILQPNGQWEFSFRVSIIKTTDFYCYFFNGKYHVAFDVYIQGNKLVAKCGGNHCIWTAQDDGFYLYNMDSRKQVKLHYWSK